MTYLDPIPSDWTFVAAAYGVILGGVGLYALGLVRRLRRARGAERDTNLETASGPGPEPPADPGA